MDVYVAEVIGTLVLILFGDGVVANALLKETKGEGSDWMVISTAWGLGVAMAVYAVGWVSGGHINPAVTIGLAAIGEFPWAQVPGYVLAQVLGAFLGAVLVYLAYMPHWKASMDPAEKLAVFATAPAIRHLPSNFLTEVIGTAVLLFGVLAIAANSTPMEDAGAGDLVPLFATGLGPLLVGLLVWVIGLSLGGPTGYAINPARDLGPRLASFLTGYDTAFEDQNGSLYFWVPIVGPLIGGLIGAGLYKGLIEYFLPAEDEEQEVGEIPDSDPPAHAPRIRQ